jgi:[CysO sulfur-carrier protein]-S-L-cysteine hydrolase
VLQLDSLAYAQMLGHAYDEVPLEACGLLVGIGDRCTRFVPTDNVAKSAIVYTVDPKQHLRAEIAAEDAGEAVIGVMHSHTHTDAYPSATDIAAAPDPSWHYVIVSLRDDAPMLRSWLIDGSKFTEEQVVVAR